MLQKAKERPIGLVARKLRLEKEKAIKQEVSKIKLTPTQEEIVKHIFPDKWLSTWCNKQTTFTKQLRYKEVVDYKLYTTKGEWKKQPYNSNFTIGGMITGCGAAQCNGLTNFRADRHPDDLKAWMGEIVAEAKRLGVGVLIGTLGNDFFKQSHDSVIAAGWIQVAEYSNWQHGSDGRYMQRLYIYIVK